MAVFDVATYKREARAGNMLAAFILELAGDLREMGQRVNNDGFSAIAKTILIGAVSIMIAAAVSAAFGAVIAIAVMKQQLNDGFCYRDQRMDRIEHIMPPRNCP